MKALILVGGFGTRLRPLTFSIPKPLIDFANKPMIIHQIEALAKVGVKEIILAINYQPEVMKEELEKYEKKYKVKITYSQETEPLGTAGPINLAKDIICKDNEEQLFFVFNSDIICDFPLDKLIAFHKSHGKEGTIMLTQVEDPSKYGVVLYEEDGKIKSFVEKPKEFIGNRINAGLYIFNTKMIKRIPSKPTSIEREIFPAMAKEGELFALNLEGFWMDVGQPKDYLSGTYIYLNYLKTKDPQSLATGENIIGNVLIHPSAKIAKNAIIGPDVIIGPDCVIEEGVRVQRTTILKESIIKSNSWISESIIGWKCTLGKWLRMEGLSVLGEDVEIKNELFINGVIIMPHKTISASIHEKNTIIM